MDRSGIFWSRPPGGESPEAISLRYHLIRVLVTLSVAGGVTVLIGLAALIDPENVHPIRYFGGCALTALVLGALITVLVRKRNLPVTTIELIVVAGLLTTYANTIYGGVLGVDPWWQVCGYSMVIMVAGGVSLRRWSAFIVFIVTMLIAWIIVINDADLANTFVFDTYVLMLLGAVTAGAILVLFLVERRRVTALNRDLQASASHDPLTGVLNRNGLVKAQLRRRRGDLPYGTEPAWCAFVDVDRFKRINDVNGHDHGDEVLRIVARALIESTPEGSLTARWGGDEFVVVGFGPAPDGSSIRTLVNSRISEVEPDGSITIGLASSAEAGTSDITSLLKLADNRMYDQRLQDRSSVRAD
ncbi:MAG: GGDEF domain-containing protein [Solirubrobacterales bacterium]